MPSDYTALSLFSGAFGLDLGLERAGFEVIWANELEKVFCQTIKNNRPHIPIVPGDVRLISPQNVLDVLGLKAGEVNLVNGGPPCQSFSTAGRRGSLLDPRGDLIMEYVKWIDVVRPRYFIMENVRGLLSAAIKHVPLAERVKNRSYSTEETHGSTLNLLLEEMNLLGYAVNYELLNAADYGVPQTRHRVVFVGSREGDRFEFPVPTHSSKPDDGLPNHLTLRDAFTNLDDPKPEYIGYSEDRIRWLNMVPPGSNWRSIPKDLQEEAMGGAYNSGGGKVGFYRRLGWDKPSPTITTSPAQKATDMCHPDETRPLTVREAARVQQFPDDWLFAGSISQKYRQIGNAVPVGLAAALGSRLMQHIQLVDGVQSGSSPDESEQLSEKNALVGVE